MLKQQSQSKSPMTLLFLITLLVISTLVMVSNYFFRPGLELDIKKKVISTLFDHNIFNAVITVEGRDVTLNGIALNVSAANKIEADVQKISGINEVENNLLVKDQLTLDEAEQLIKNSSIE